MDANGELGRLAGKVAIVTGSGSSGPGVGTGKATAILLARHGAKVLLVDRDEAAAQETLAQIQSEGARASTFAADVTRRDDCQALTDAALARYGRLDVLINNVGVGGRGNVVDVTEDDWDRVLDINLKSMMLTSKFAVPALAASGGGAIVHIASIEALRVGGLGVGIAYNASKGGVLALTTAMAVHHGRAGIRVNAIVPGYLYTPMVGPYLTDEMRDLRRRSAPLGTEGTAWDVASACLFLASDEARWITGVALPVDGGLLAATPLAMRDHLM